MQKTKSMFLTFFLIACLVTQAFLFWTPSVNASTVVSSQTFSAVANPSTVDLTNADYATVQSTALGATVTTSASALTFGQHKGTTFQIWRYLSTFATSSLGSIQGISIINVTWCMYITQTDVDGSQFNVTVQVRNSSAPAMFPHQPLWKGDYDYNNWTGNLGTYDTTLMDETDIYYNITLNDNSVVSTSGNTYILARSDRDISATSPTGTFDEWIKIDNPLLVVFYYQWGTTETPKYVKYHSTLSDGYLTGSNTVYATCNAGNTGTVTNTTSDLYVGQKSDNSSYQTFSPTGAGASTEWTPNGAATNWQCVLTNDADTTYVHAEAGDQQDLYDVTDNSFAPTTFAQINVTVLAKATTATSAFRIMIQADGTIYQSSALSITTSYVAYSAAWTMNPKTGGAWNDTSLDSLQIGVNYTYTAYHESVTQIYVDVYYVTYTDYRSAIPISTGGIPDNATLVNAALYVYVATDNTEVNFNLWVMNSTDGTYPSDPLATTSFNKTNYPNAGGSVSTTGAGWLTIVFNATGLAMISKTGNTKLFLVSNRDYAGTTPSVYDTQDTEYVIISSKEATETQNPFMVVAWTATLAQTIYTDEISAAESNWSPTGTSPYIDDSSVNYLESYTATNSSWFTFPDLLSDLPQQVWLEVEAQTGATSSYCQIIMDEGTTNYTIATVCFGRFTAWKSYNVTTELNTLAKLNATKVKFNSLNATTGYGSRIYRLRLRLFSGPCPYNDTSKIGATTPEVSTTTTFYCYWQGTLSSASVTHNCTGSFATTNTTLSGSDAWSNFTATTPSNSTYNVVYWFNANDTNNYWERTENYTLKLLWPSYDPTAYNMVDNDTGTLAHSLGRQAFFDPVTNLYWIKYFKLNASALWNLDWAYSSDSEAWMHGGTIRENATVTDAGSGFTYWLLEQRGGVSYCHIQYGDEAVNSNIYYRRGLLNSDGTITFTAWQTAVTGPANQRICVEGFAVSPSGHVWIEYECDAGGGSYSFGYGNITLSTATDGTWSTHTSYPKKVMDNNGAIHEGLVFSAGQDYYAIIVICHSSNAIVKNFMKSYEIQNNVLQSVVNASTTPTYEARWFSVTRDSSNQLHLVYKNWTDYINYCKWNTTSWNVQDTNIGYGSAYPVISCHKTINETYVNWVIDGDCYVNTMNASGWRGLERMHTLEGQKEYADPNHVIEQVDQYVLFAFNVYNFSDAVTEIWSYRYSVTLVARITFTSIGSNSTVTSQPCLLYAYATESGGVGMSYANVRFYDGSTWDNNTFTALSASMAIWTNFTKTLPSSIIAIVQWQIYVNDTNGQWAYTAVQTITLTANLYFLLGDRLTIPITSAYLKGLHAPINDALEIVTYEMLLKNMLFQSTANLRQTGGTSTAKGLTSDFAETVKPNLTFDFLKLLYSSVTDVLDAPAFSESWKTLPFNPSDTVKPLSSLSTTLNIPTYLTSIVSGLVPIHDSSTMTKAWTNLFSETVRPNLNTILLKFILNPLGTKLSTLGSSDYSKNLPIQFGETVKPDLTFNFLKALNIPFGSMVSSSTFIQYWKTMVFTSSDTLKPYGLLSTSLDIRSFLTSIVSGLVPVRDSLTQTKMWTNTFPQTLNPNMNEMLLKNILSPLGNKLSSLDSNSFSKTVPFQMSETLLSNINMLFLKALLSPLGSTVTIPTSMEATKTLVFKASDVLKPLDYVTMIIGVAAVHIESFLGDMLQLQASLSATKNMMYLPADILKIAGARYVPGLAVVEDLSAVWMVLGLVGFVLGISAFALTMGKRRRDE